MSVTTHGRHERTRPTSVRTILLVLGVLAVQLGFIASYVGAFHSPTPRGITLAVVAPAGAPPGSGEQLAQQLDSLPGHPLAPMVVADEAAARQRITDRDTYGALLLGPQRQDTLLVASGAGASVATALESTLTAVDAAQQRTVTVQDVVGVSAQDNRGLSGFYLAVGWVVGGYLLSTALRVISPARRVREMAVRLGVLTGYAIASGIGGALLAGPVLGALTGHFWALAGFGALVVLATAAFTTALAALLGYVGIGLVIVLFVVLGNPSAGGAYGAPLIPPFWAAVGPWLTPGAATQGIRSIAYFGGTGVGAPLGVLAGYLVLGAAGALLTTAIQARRHPDAPATHAAGHPVTGPAVEATTPA